jgi:hypothetical protein
MPMVRMMPAMPGRVRVALKAARPPAIRTILAVRAISAMIPAHLIIENHKQDHQDAADQHGEQPLADRVFAQGGPTDFS